MGYFSGKNTLLAFISFCNKINDIETGEEVVLKIYLT